MYHDFGDDLVVGALEHEFYDFPYIGNNDPN
jgi:methanogenic corrinoid protein MtbC1